MKKKYPWMIIIGLAIILTAFIFFRGTGLMFPMILFGIILAWARGWLDFFVREQGKRNLDQKFPAFVRNLTGAIKSGMPVSKAIVHISDNDYGPLSPYIQKLANKVDWSVSLHKALEELGNSTKSSVIQRAVATVIEAEKAGGNIEDVLGKVTDSLATISKLKEERKAAIHGQVVQSYIIFIVFMGVMIIIQNMLIPFIAEVGEGDSEFSGDGAGIGFTIGGGSLGALTSKAQVDWSSPATVINSSVMWLKSVYGIFMMLAAIEGFFAGLVIGKLSEGSILAGMKHSLILSSLALFVMSMAQYFA